MSRIESRASRNGEATMSKAEIDRFSNDLKANASLQARVKAAGTKIAAVLQVANAQGYAITMEDVRDYIRSQGQELTDVQIDAAVGGFLIQIAVYYPMIKQR